MSSLGGSGSARPVWWRSRWTPKSLGTADEEVQDLLNASPGLNLGVDFLPASLYFHHGWARGVTDPGRFAHQTWDVGDHVMKKYAEDLLLGDERISGQLDIDVFVNVLDQVPDEWLEQVPGASTAADIRAAYVAFLSARLMTRNWLPGAPS